MLAYQLTGNNFSQWKQIAEKITPNKALISDQEFDFQHNATKDLIREDISSINARATRSHDPFATLSAEKIKSESAQSILQNLKHLLKNKDDSNPLEVRDSPSHSALLTNSQVLTQISGCEDLQDIYHNTSESLAKLSKLQT
jgi:hypothetical protein